MAEDGPLQEHTVMRIDHRSLSVTCALLLCACAAPQSEPDARGSTRPTPPATGAAGSEGSASPLLGTWDHAYSRAEAEVVVDDFREHVQDADQVVARLGFLDADTWWLGFLFDGEMVLVDGVPEGDGGSYTVRGDRLTTTGSHGEIRVTYTWSLRGRALTLRAVEECALHAGAVTRCERDRAAMDPLMLLITEQTFTRSGDDATY